MPRFISAFDTSLNSIVVLGDSRPSQQFVDASTKLRKPAYNPLTIASQKLGQRIRWYNLAVSGLRSDQYLAASYFNAALATNAHWLMIWGIVNDVSQNGNAVDYWTAYVKPAALAWIAQGRRVILITEPGSNSLSGSAANVGAVAKYNRQIRQFCLEQPGAVLIDVAATVMDPTATMTFKTSASGDGTHINLVAGAFLAGQEIANVLGALIPPYSGLVTTPGEIFANGGVQFFPNPTFQTTSGGTGGTGVTGTVPSGITSIILPASWTCTISTGAGSYGNDVTLAISAAASGIAKIQMDLSSVESAGDVMYANCEVDVSAGASRLQSASLMLESNRASVSQTGEDGYCAVGNGQWPSTAQTVTLQTPDMTIAAGARGWLTAYLNAYFDAAGSATIKLRRMGVWRKQAA